MVSNDYIIFHFDAFSLDKRSIGLLSDSLDDRIYFNVKLGAGNRFSHFASRAVEFTQFHSGQHQFQGIAICDDFYRIRKEMELYSLLFSSFNFFNHGGHIIAFAPINQVNFGAFA